MTLTPRGVSALMDWFVEAGTPTFDLAVLRRTPRGHKAAFLDPTTTRARDLPLEGIHSRLSWLRAENANGADIYFRPTGHYPQPVVFLDDLGERLARAIARKYRAAVIRTSPDRCHLWLSLCEPVPRHQRTSIQQDLIYRLAGAADPGSVSGDHFGRLPGFRNRKPGRSCWVDLLVLSYHKPYIPDMATRRPPLPLTPPTTPPDRDMSRAEWGWVLGRLEQGAHPSDVLTRLIDRARTRRGSQDAIRYAHHTLRKACQITGRVFTL